MIPAGLNVEAFKTLCKDIAPAARAVVMARAFAQVERERVRAYTLPILARYRFTVDLDCSKKGEPITDPDHLYLSEDEPGVRAYFAELDAAHREHGARNLPAGHCPALTADHLRIQAEQGLIELACPFFGIEPHQLFRGDFRARFLDLILGACLKDDTTTAREMLKGGRR